MKIGGLFLCLLHANFFKENSWAHPPNDHPDPLSSWDPAHHLCVIGPCLYLLNQQPF